jgi:hypothetical protein
MTELSILTRIAHALDDNALVANLIRIQTTLDEWAAEGFDVDTEADLRLDRAQRDALRAEWRKRSGERI